MRSYTVCIQEKQFCYGTDIKNKCGQYISSISSREPIQKQDNLHDSQIVGVFV